MADEATIERFRAMTVRFPDSELPWFSLGRALHEARQFAEAAVAFDAACARRPDMMMAWLHAAECLAADRRWSEARERASEAHRLAVGQGHSGPQADATALIEEVDDELDA